MHARVSRILIRNARHFVVREPGPGQVSGNVIGNFSTRGEKSTNYRHEGTEGEAWRRSRTLVKSRLAKRERERGRGRGRRNAGENCERGENPNKRNDDEGEKGGIAAGSGLGFFSPLGIPDRG